MVAQIDFLGQYLCKIITLASKLSNETYVHYYGNISELMTKVTQTKQKKTSFWHNMHPGCCDPYMGAFIEECLVKSVTDPCQYILKHLHSQGGDSMWKQQEKHNIFFFLLLTKKGKSFWYYSNKNIFVKKKFGNFWQQIFFFFSFFEVKTPTLPRGRFHVKAARKT